MRRDNTPGIMGKHTAKPPRKNPIFPRKSKNARNARKSIFFYEMISTPTQGEIIQ